MIELKELLKMDIEEIISSSVHSLTLLKIYSKLYLNGTQPRGCAKSQRKYYSQLKKDYQMKKQIIERTCIPKFEGRRYIPGVFDKDGKLIAGHLHIFGSMLTDEKAKELLDIGALKKKDFIKLPGEKAEVKEYTKEESKEILDIGALKKKDFIKLPGEKAEVKEYTKEELKEILEKGNYEELSKAARDLGLIKTSANKEKTIEVLNDYISE